MKMFLQNARRSRAAMTLIETMMAASIGGMIVGSIVLGTAAFNRVFNASNESFKAIGDEMRALDYIARDMRSAVNGTVSNNGQTLTLNLPNYLDTSVNPPVPRTPSVALGAASVTTGNGIVTYGTAGGYVQVVYKMDPRNPQNIIRTETPPGGTPTTVTLSADVVDFQLINSDPDNANNTNFSFGGPGQPPAVKTSITFKRKFSMSQAGRNNSRAGTEVDSTTSVRNHK